MSILTTTRPMTNADRRTLWQLKREQIPSPPGAVEQPGQFRFWVSVLKELAGWALLAATSVAFLALLQWSMEAV